MNLRYRPLVFSPTSWRFLGQSIILMSSQLIGNTCITTHEFHMQFNKFIHMWVIWPWSRHSYVSFDLEAFICESSDDLETFICLIWPSEIHIRIKWPWDIHMQSIWRLRNIHMFSIWPYNIHMWIIWPWLIHIWIIWP